MQASLQIYSQFLDLQSTFDIHLDAVGLFEKDEILNE